MTAQRPTRVSKDHAMQHEEIALQLEALLAGYTDGFEDMPVNQAFLTMPEYLEAHKLGVLERLGRFWNNDHEVPNTRHRLGKPGGQDPFSLN